MEGQVQDDPVLTPLEPTKSVTELPTVHVLVHPQVSKWTVPTKFWEVLAQVLVLWSIVTTQVIFWYQCTYDHRHSMDTIGMLIIFYICDLIYLLDTILRFRNTWKNVRSRRLSWENIKKVSPFILDLLSLFPLEVFALTVGENNPSIRNSERNFAKIFEDGSFGKALVNSAFSRLENFHKTIAILKSNRLIRLYRIPAFYRETRNQRPNVFAIVTIRLAICFACFLVLLCHSIACIWFSMNCVGVLATGHPPECKRLGKGFHSIYKYSALNQTDPFVWYLGGLHWSVMSLRNAGDPVQVASTSIQMLYSIITQFIGFYMSIMLLLLTTHIATIMDLKRSKFFQEAHGARKFADHMKINKESTMMDFMYKSCNFMWKNERGFTDLGMIHILPKRLRTDMSMHLFNPMIQKSEILRTCFDQNELEILASHVQFKHYFGNSFLIRPNAIGSCMFYVIRGSIDIMDENSAEPTILFTLGRGSLIGEVDAFLPRLRLQGVKTRMECDVLKLSNAAVTKLIGHDPESLEKVIHIISQRTQFGNTANAEPEKLYREKQRETSIVTRRISTEATSTQSSTLTTFEEQSSYEDKEHSPKTSQTIHLSPLTWLQFFKRNPKTLAKVSQKAEDAKNTLAQYQKYPDSENKYNFVQIPPSPEHRWKYGVISKKSIVADIWDFIVFVAALIYSYGVPISFMYNDDINTNRIDILVDVVNILDLVSILVVFYDPSEMHQTINYSSRWAHVKREFRNPKILLPLIPIFSFHQVWRLTGMSYRTYLYASIHLYIIRLITVHLYFRRWEHDVRSNVIALRMLKNIIYVTIYLIFFSCIFCSFGCHKYPNCEQINGETWVGQYVKSSSDIDLKEFYDAFYLSFYWSLSTIVGIGYTTDDLVLVQKKETTLFTVNLVLSFVLLTYFFANVGAAICGQVENVVNHKNTKMALLRYLDDELTDLNLMDQVRTFMDLQWTKFFGLNSPNQIEFLKVSHSMFNEVLVSVAAETLHKAYFFQYMSPHVLKEFCCVSKIVVLPPNVCLLTEGEIVEALHVIRRGYAKVYKGTTSIEVDVLSTGQSFGDIELIYGQPSRVTIRSLTHVELVSIKREDFEEVLASSNYHSQEVAEMRSNPKDQEWFQQHFVPTESQWRKNPYVPPPAPPQVCHWYSYKGDPNISPEHDPYLAKFYAHPWLTWLRYFMIPCGLVPTGYAVYFWGKLRAHLVLLQLIFVPMVEAYPYMKQDYMWIIYILDFVATLDMAIRAHTGYYERKTKGLVTHPLLTAMHYFSGPFIVDFYGSLPVYLLIDQSLETFGFDGPNPGPRLLAYFLRMNRLIGVYRYWNYMRDDVVKDLTGKNNWKIACLLSFFLIFQTHIVACITIVIACPTTISELLNQVGICYPNTWITRGKHTLRMQANNQTIAGWDIYLFAFYYTATTSVGCGFGDFKPVGKLELYITSLQLFVYIIVFTYALAKVASSRCLFDFKLLRFQRNIKYLVGWLSRENVDLELAGQILRHYDYYWMRTEGIWSQDLWPYLYPTLKKDVMYDTYESVFRLVPEFDRVPTVFMREILALLQVRFYLNHEVIVRVGEVCEFIYIIGNGNLVVKLGKSIEPTVDSTIQLSIGGILGSMDPSYCVALHDCTAICWTSVDMFVIRRSQFLEVLRNYPDVAARFVIPQKPGTNYDGTTLEMMTRLKEGLEGRPLNLVQTTTLRLSLKQELDEVIAAHLESKLGTKENKNLKLRPQSTKSLPKQFSAPTLEEVLEQYEIRKKEEDKTRCGREELLKASVLPVSRSFLFLDNLCFWAAVTSSGVTGFQFAFMRFQWIFWILGFITDGIFILKMILRFFITYYDQMGDLISHVLEIEKGYMRYDGFIMDLFTAIPLELFTLIYTAVAAESPEKEEVAFTFWASLRLNRLLRLHFVWKYISNMLSHGGITVNLVHLKIKRLLITTILLIHWLVVIFYLSSVSFRSTSENLCKPNANNTGYLEVNYATFSPTSWVETKAETGHRLCSPYIMTLYFLVNTFTTTGYGDIYPITAFEIIFISLLAMMSKVYVGVALTDVLSGLQYYVDKTYHISSDVVVGLYRSYGIPQELTHQVKSYFTYAWLQNEGVLMPDLLHQAPEVHRLDICFDAYGHVLQNSPLFEDLPKLFLKRLCIKFQTVWVLKGDCIVRQDDLDDRIYFVHRGVIHSQHEDLDEHGNSRIKEEYCMGTAFGEVNGIMGTTNYQRTYTAMTNVDLLYLTHEDLEEVFQFFPAEKIEIRNRLEEMYNSLIEDSFDEITL